jgi:hypothetical protein
MDPARQIQVRWVSVAAVTLSAVSLSSFLVELGAVSMRECGS